MSSVSRAWEPDVHLKSLEDLGMRPRQTRQKKSHKRRTQRGGGFLNFLSSPSTAPRPTTGPREGSAATLTMPKFTEIKPSYGKTCGDPCMIDYGSQLEFTSPDMSTWKTPKDWCWVRDEHRPGCSTNLSKNVEANIESNPGSVVSNIGSVGSNVGSVGSNTGSVGSSNSVQSTNTRTSIARNRKIAMNYPHPNRNIQTRRLAAINAREAKHIQKAEERGRR